MVSGFFTSPFDHVRIDSAVASPILSCSKSLTSNIYLEPRPLRAAPFTFCVFLVAAPLGAFDADTELLGRAEHVLVELAHLDLLARVGEHLHVEAEGLHLLDEHLEGLGDAWLGDVLA